MKLWIRTLIFKEIITGLALNYGKTLTVIRTRGDSLNILKKSGHSLLIESIFGKIEFEDSEGTLGLFPIGGIGESYWDDSAINVLRDIIKSGIGYEIIGNQEELDCLYRKSPPLHDEIMDHIVWKAKKRASQASKS